jgi:hypothetical protein
MPRRPKAKIQKSVTAFIFDAISVLLENAAYLTGWRSDIDRAVISANLHDGEKWLVSGAELPNGTGTLRLFQVPRPVGDGSATYALEQYDEGYCLWCLDEVQGGVIYVLDHTMESMAGWDDRNNVTYSMLNLTPETYEDHAALN